VKMLMFSIVIEVNWYKCLAYTWLWIVLSILEVLRKI